MSYQAVVRNTTNNLVVSQNVGMQISILQGSATGTVVYVETQTPTSNTNGLVTIEIGGGTVVSGNFATINWANGPYFIKTETDPTGGSSYTITGTSQLLSSPYALYAKTSGSSTPGPAGPMGPQGPQGLTGATGPAGANGTNGLDGATGPMGPQGPQGLTGATGPAGTNGTNGLDGATGPMGPQGPQGLTGATGPAGANGTNGLDGATGPMGAQGPQGLTGATGPAGANGTNGLDGATGPMGPQGPQGLTGATGPAGANGTNGLDGATGPMGPQGPQGLTGATGPAGANGTNGLDGATGPMGPQGLTGPAGPQGLTGATGNAGIGYGGTSNSGKTISLGSKTFVVQAGLAYIAGERIRFVDQTNSVNFLEGTITSYSGTTMVVTIDNTGGTGTILNWNLSVGGNLGTTGATGAAGLQGPTGATGATGANGVGVPTGGTTGQVLAKVNATDFNTQWVTPSAGGSGATVQLIANKVGGSSETLPVATSITPTTIVFNNVLNAPSLGSYNNTTGVFTVGTSGAGSYLIQVKLLCNDATPVTSTVPPYLTLIKNNATYGSNGADVFYGDYPTLHNVLPTGIKGQGSLNKVIQLAAGDTFRIVAVSANSSTAAQPTSTVAGSNITIIKL